MAASNLETKLMQVENKLKLAERRSIIFHVGTNDIGDIIAIHQQENWFLDFWTCVIMTEKICFLISKEFVVLL